MKSKIRVGVRRNKDGTSDFAVLIKGVKLNAKALGRTIFLVDEEGDTDLVADVFGVPVEMKMVLKVYGKPPRSQQKLVSLGIAKQIDSVKGRKPIV